MSARSDGITQRGECEFLSGWRWVYVFMCVCVCVLDLLYLCRLNVLTVYRSEDVFHILVSLRTFSGL